MSAAPFTDPDLLRGALYATSDRLARRTSALHAAKIEGSDAAATITDLAAGTTPPAPVVLDIGCGRGTTTLRLASRLPAARVIAVDRSPALLAETTRRAADQRRTVRAVCADFHHLPLATGTADLAVAAFCLYHSPRPHIPVAEIARCLSPSGHAILATKSADSYQELDDLVTTAELDPGAATAPSLYATFHSGNLEDIAATALRVEHVHHERHVFRFADFDHLAAYLVTSPKHRLPPPLAGNRERIAGELRRRLPESPAVATSTVTYAVAARR